MRRISLLLFTAILLLNAPLVYGATTAELQAQIALLLQQVQALQAQLQASQSVVLDFQFNLQRGSTDAATGGEVSKLQQFLAKDKVIYPEGLVTGYFGSLTEAAVKRWQEKNKIEAIGVVGPKTRAAIKSATAVVPASPPASGSTAPTSTAPTSTPPVSQPSASTSPSASLGGITLSPSSAGVGETVTITGSGFTASGNDIHFGTGGVKNINSFNSGTMITFQVPSGVSPCDLVVAGTVICSDPKIPVAPGSYTVYVTNSSGATATTTLTVTSGASYPSIVTISPDRGRVGDTITVTGSGLDLMGNEVHLGIGGTKVNTLRKVKGTLLNFTVPATINDCDFSTGLPPCTGKSYSIVPGNYALYIVSSSGRTNSVNLTITQY